MHSRFSQYNKYRNSPIYEYCSKSNETIILSTLLQGFKVKSEIYQFLYTKINRNFWQFWQLWQLTKRFICLHWQLSITFFLYLMAWTVGACHVRTHHWPMSQSYWYTKWVQDPWHWPLYIPSNLHCHSRWRSLWTAPIAQIRRWHNIHETLTYGKVNALLRVRVIRIILVGKLLHVILKTITSSPCFIHYPTKDLDVSHSKLGSNHSHSIGFPRFIPIICKKNK